MLPVEVLLQVPPRPVVSVAHMAMPTLHIDWLWCSCSRVICWCWLLNFRPLWTALSLMSLAGSFISKGVIAVPAADLLMLLHVLIELPYRTVGLLANIALLSDCLPLILRADVSSYGPSVTGCLHNICCILHNARVFFQYVAA